MSRPDKLSKILTEEETDCLLQQSNQRYFGPHRDFLFMRLMLKAGLQASEAVSLRPEHADPMSGKLMVREGKGAKDRTLWIGKEMLSELQGWMDRRKAIAGDSEFLLSREKERGWLPLIFAVQLSSTLVKRVLTKWSACLRIH